MNTAPELPALPDRGYANIDGWSDDAMQAYGAACAAAEREACAKLAEPLKVADAIRARGAA